MRQATDAMPAVFRFATLKQGRGVRAASVKRAGQRIIRLWDWHDAKKEASNERNGECRDG